MKIILLATIFLTTLYPFIEYKNQGCFDLWYSRNLIYANDGYCFKSKLAKRFFNQKCSKKYISNLNNFEIKDIQEILKEEKKKGCKEEDLTLNIQKPYFKDKKSIVITLLNKNFPLVRTKPSIKGKILDEIHIIITQAKTIGYSKDKNWALIEYENYGDIKRGWILSKYIKSKREFKSAESLSYQDKKEILKALVKELLDQSPKYENIFFDAPLLKSGNIRSGIKIYKNGTFDNELYYIDEFKCKKIESNRYRCRLGLGVNMISGDGESYTMIEFLISKSGNSFKVDKILKFELAG